MIDQHQHSRPSLSCINCSSHSPRIWVALLWIVTLAGVSARCTAQSEASAEERFRRPVARPNIGDVLAWNGREYAPQRKAVFEVRDYDKAGVDCTGNTDSSAFLNSLTSTEDPTGTSWTISTRDCPLLRADHWVIHGQEYLELDLGPLGPGYRPQGGTWLFGCSGRGAVLQIDRSGYTYVHGGAIAANSVQCPGHTSTLTGSIEYTNSGSGGYTSTHNTLADTILTSGMNGEAIDGYRAYFINGTPNQEAFRLQNVLMLGQNSPHSIGFYSNDENADSTTWDGGGASGFYRMVQMDAGRLRLLHTNNSFNGSYSIFGRGGAAIAQTIIGCVTEMVENVFDNSGTLIRSGTQTSFGCNNYLRGNQASPTDIDPSVHFIELGFQVGTDHMLDNNFSSGHSPPILDNAIAGSVPDGGTGQVQVLDGDGNNLTNDVGHVYKLHQ